MKQVKLIINNYSFKKEAVMSYFFSLARIIAHYQSIKDNFDKLNRNEIIFEYE